MLENKLENKVAIVTGGSKGIGFGIASALASKGAMVYLVARTKSKLEAARDKIKEKGGKADIRSGDITDIGRMGEIIDSVYDLHGRLDIFVNNAGEFESQTIDTSLKDIKEILTLDFLAPFEITHYLINKFKNKKDNELKILTVASQAALEVMDGGVGYGTAKTALVSALRHLDKEMKRAGITNIRNYRLYPNTTYTEGTAEAIKNNEIQNPTTLESVVDAAMDLILDEKTPTRDMRIGFYPGEGIVKTDLSSGPDFPRVVRKVVVDSKYTPKDLF